jgi:hypothetical protein
VPSAFERKAGEGGLLTPLSLVNCQLQSERGKGKGVSAGRESVVCFGCAGVRGVLRRSEEEEEDPEGVEVDPCLLESSLGCRAARARGTCCRQARSKGDRCSLLLCRRALFPLHTAMEAAL